MAIRHHIGLEIAEREFRFVEVRIVDGESVILHAEKVETSREFGSPLLHEAPFRKDLAKAFISDMNALFQRHNLLAATVSVALPVSVCLVTTLPVDPRQNEEERNEQFAWECRTLMSLSPEIKVRILSTPIQNQGHSEQHLLVALPEATLVFLASVLSHLTFTVLSIEPNHFVYENSLVRQERERGGSGFAVCGLFDSCCSVGVYAGEMYRGFRSGIVSYRQHLASSVLLHLEDILRGHGSIRLDRLHLFGSAATAAVAHTFRQLLHIDVQQEDRATTVPFASSTIESRAFQETPFSFDTALRAALREAE